MVNKPQRPFFAPDFLSTKNPGDEPGFFQAVRDKPYAPTGSGSFFFFLDAPSAKT